MAISLSDTKLLWGRAAGKCSNPECRKDLTHDLGADFNVGEMAHVVAKQPTGPRGKAKGGDDTYDNLVLLCPTCHRMIDKAPPGTFPEEMLFSWKAQHEDLVQSIGAAFDAANFEELKQKVSGKLMENRCFWDEFGPASKEARTNPNSNLAGVWDLRKLDTIVPNNQEIINAVENNTHLLSPAAKFAFVKFKAHAVAFEQNQYERLDNYPTFPEEFEKEFMNV